ncbi:hypothetical protein AK812_SmicGene42355 [Symbiodinium microadriaticum]|uniref:Uncharacterized protein n=1 Tax=Symbiodinium microadriaticum TaxID=2951 RepID=A0A1Q9C3S3_SYMMI|nr:hypothetical protein AK812_SmicGene42355 [Symbiodinium microadriaticum]
MWAQVTECASDRERVGASDGATELVESRGAMSCAVGDATKKLQEMMQHSEDGDRRVEAVVQKLMKKETNERSLSPTLQGRAPGLSVCVVAWRQATQVYG